MEHRCGQCAFPDTTYTENTVEERFSKIFSKSHISNSKVSEWLVTLQCLTLPRLLFVMQKLRRAVWAPDQLWYVCNISDHQWLPGQCSLAFPPNQSTAAFTSSPTYRFYTFLWGICCHNLWRTWQFLPTESEQGLLSCSYYFSAAVSNFFNS